MIDAAEQFGPVPRYPVTRGRFGLVVPGVPSDGCDIATHANHPQRFDRWRWMISERPSSSGDAHHQHSPPSSPRRSSPGSPPSPGRRVTLPLGPGIATNGPRAPSLPMTACPASCSGSRSGWLGSARTRGLRRSRCPDVPPAVHRRRDGARRTRRRRLGRRDRHHRAPRAPRGALVRDAVQPRRSMALAGIVGGLVVAEPRRRRSVVALDPSARHARWPRPAASFVLCAIDTGT